MTRSDAGSRSGRLLRDELSRGTAMLAAAGCDTPRLDAEVLLAEALVVTRSDLVIRSREAVCPEEATRYQELLERRARREPVAYILGRREFRRISVEVDPRVLIPRPETE